MKRCKHTQWFSHCTQGGEAALLESDRLQSLLKHTPHPGIQYPSLFVLIGNKEKTIALRALFGLKRDRNKRNTGEVHLHLDPSTLFNGRPILLAEGDSPQPELNNNYTKPSKCHEVIRRHLQKNGNWAPFNVYTRLLFPFTDVFCFFSADLGGFRQTAHHLGLWLEKGHSSSLPTGTLPSILIVTDEVTEIEARNSFLRMVQEETTEDIFQHISAIDVIAIFPDRMMSNQARYRRVKERIMMRSDQVRRNREDTRTLFSATHFSAFLSHACGHFAETVNAPFNFVKASRAQNLVPLDLDDHISTFMKHITSSDQLIKFAAPMIASTLLLDSYPPEAHTFDPRTIFNALYKDVLLKVSKVRVLAFEKSKDVVLRSGFITMVEKNLVQYFQQLSDNTNSTAADIHKSNLAHFADRWSYIQSSNTCLCCLRRRPQYSLPCGHCLCENCVILFGSRCEDDPWVFKISRCFLCEQDIPTDINVRTHPPTAGVGVLCIDGGGTRGIVPLTIMKLIQDRLGPIPLQRCITVSFGVSVGVIIAIDHFIFGRPLEDSIKTFSGMTSRVFKRRISSSFPLASRIAEAVLSYFTDGLYPAGNVDTVLQDWAKNKRILDCSHATSTGTKVGLPVATVSKHPSHRFFTNYNGFGERDSEEENAIIKPKDGFGNVPLWEIARSASAAPGFFPPKYINGVGTFQDVGALENDPVIWALSELTAIFPLVREPNFVISLGTGEPERTNYEVSTEDCRNIWKNGMLHRFRDLIMERMREKSIKRAYKTVAPIAHKIHRLSVDFETTEPRLDDAKSIPELMLKVEADQSLSMGIDEVARCLVASLFYFELDSSPKRQEGKYILTGHILCSIRQTEPAFKHLFSNLENTSAKFLVNDWPIPGLLLDSSCIGNDGNFGMRVTVEAFDKFTVLLKQGGSKAYSISGSPFSVKGLVDAQGLDAPFGRADHGKRKRSWSNECRSRKRVRLWK